MKKNNTSSFFGVTLLAILMVIASSVKTFAQVPTNQDCRDAIPICTTTYHETTNWTGTGNYPNDVNSGLSACTFTENNSSWYIVTCQTAGTLGFLLTPGDPSADFNWAIYNQSGTFTCANIYTNSALEVGCNTDATPGPTGMCGGVGPQFGSQIAVAAGATYVICISNISGSNMGFTLDFSCSTTQINDNVPPHMSSINAPVACNATAIKVRFSEEVTCATATNPANWYVTNSAMQIINVQSLLVPIAE